MSISTVPKVGDFIYNVDTFLDIFGNPRDGGSVGESSPEQQAANRKSVQDTGLDLNEVDYIRRRWEDALNGEEVLRVYEDSFLTVYPYRFSKSDKPAHWTREYRFRGDGFDREWKWVATKEELFALLDSYVAERETYDPYKQLEEELKRRNATTKFLKEEAQRLKNQA